MTNIYKPTWLYIKQHNQTGLKYFGKTVETDPHKYRGSGKYWNNHLRKHGNDVTTVWCKLFESESEIQNFALKFSAENNIVESKEWANLKPENGKDGWVPGSKWWNDGNKNQLSINSPGQNWKLGRINQKPINNGKKFYHNNKKQVFTEKCPGPGWINGMLPEIVLKRSTCLGQKHSDEKRKANSVAQRNRNNIVKYNLSHPTYGNFYGSFRDLIEHYPEQKLLACELWKMSSGANYKLNGYKGWTIGR